jgi:hypothetical protein
MAWFYFLFNCICSVSKSRQKKLGLDTYSKSWNMFAFSRAGKAAAMENGLKWGVRRSSEVPDRLKNRNLRRLWATLALLLAFPVHSLDCLGFNLWNAIQLKAMHFIHFNDLWINAELTALMTTVFISTLKSKHGPVCGRRSISNIMRNTGKI